MQRPDGTPALRLKTILLGLLADSLDELRRFQRDIEIQRVERESGRIFMKDGRVYTLELKSEGSIRARMGPIRRR